MRVVIVALGSTGDVRPYVALGQGLCQAGHDVRLLTHERFRELGAAHGVTVMPLASDPLELLASPGGLAWQASGANPFTFARRLVRVLAPLAGPCVAQCVKAFRNTDLVVASRLALAPAAGAAEAAGIRLIPALLQPLTPTATFPSPFFSRLWPTTDSIRRATHTLTWPLLTLLGGPVFDALKQVGSNDLRPLERLVRDILEQRRAVLYGYSDRLLPKPADWNASVHVTGFWFLDPAPTWAPTPELVEFLAAGPPPVCVGFGSMTGPIVAEATRKAVAAARLAGQRVLVLGGWNNGDAAHFRTDVLTVPAVPHAWLFPRVAAVIHHGGAGTTAATLRAGAPSLVAPVFADQFFWARAVARLGAGIGPVGLATTRVTSVAAALRRLVTVDTFRGAAARLGAALRHDDGVGNAVVALTGAAIGD